METDLQLVHRARDGDQPAFAVLVRRHREKVFHLAVSILGPALVPEAEDVAQEVFLKAHKSLRAFRGEAEFCTWLYRITFNEASNVKALARHKRPHFDESALLGAAGSGPSPHQEAEDSDRNRHLTECISTLPETYQSALRLYYWLGNGVDEVAALLGVPENTAKSYLHRARQLLHGMLRQKGYEL